MLQPSPDASEKTEGRDFLNRLPLARNIYELIKASPIEWSLRIGIYGKWGEGKTTVLNFIEQLAKQDECPVAWFNPWACQTPEDLTKVFSSSLAQSLSQGSLTSGIIKQKAMKVFDFGKKLAEMNSISKAIVGAFNPMAENFLSTKKSDIENTLKDALGEKKLIVLIDDVDRTRQELLPTLLLGLRENLDFRNCVFVLALDPVVVTKALGTVHKGWESSGEFLEKIINFPFWLTQPNDLSIDRLIDSEIASSPLNIDRDALDDILFLLPKNPRKLKLFLRGLWRYQPQLLRHDKQEIEWRFLILIELLRMHSLGGANRIFNSKPFLQQLVLSAHGFAKKSKNEGEKEEDWVGCVRELLKLDNSVNEEEIRNFISILHKLKEGLRGNDEKALLYWVRAFDHPDIFTWKEFKSLMSDFQKTPNIKDLEKLLNAHAKNRGASVRATMEAFIETLVIKREESLSFAAAAVSEKDLKGHLDRACIELAVLQGVALEIRLIEGGAPLIGCQQFISIWKHFSIWAHFTNHKYYRKIRKEEEKLLLSLAKNSKTISLSILESLQPFRYFHDTFPERSDLENKIVKCLLPAVFEDLKSRFTRANGIHNLWGNDGHQIQKWVLFRRESGFYTSGVVVFLRRVKIQAKKDLDIQQNFVEYILMLAHGLEKGLPPLGLENPQGLAKDKKLMEIIWKGALATSLQPRMRGTIEKCREVLIPYADESCFPLPLKWVN